MLNDELLEIIDADYLGDYRLRLVFNDKTVKDVDLEPHLYGPVFGPLRDPYQFIQYGLDGTIEWANGADFAPGFFHDIGVDVDEKTRKSMVSEAMQYRPQMLEQ